MGVPPGRDAVCPLVVSEPRPKRRRHRGLEGAPAGPIIVACAAGLVYGHAHQQQPRISRMTLMTNDGEQLAWESWERRPYLLSFVTNENGQYLAIHADANGLEALIRALQQLQEQLGQDDCPHTHVFAGRASSASHT